MTSREYIPGVMPPKPRDYQLENAAKGAEWVKCERCDGTGNVEVLKGDREVKVYCGRCWGRGEHLEVADQEGVSQ